MPRTNADAVNAHLTDMLALEDHLERTLRARVEQTKKRLPEVADQLQPIHTHAERHTRVLRALSEARDGRFPEALKHSEDWSDVGPQEGADPLPGELRNDFAALCRASIGYVILATTARALEEPATAELAEGHLSDYAEAVKGFHGVIPAAIVRCLQLEGLPARADLVPALSGATAVLEAAPVPHPPH
ncbi:MAG TPA: hypothetical protein VIP80_13450 [Gemmatimonadales bacterium]|jgi:hypothetical protein